jgi:hypothetical protein
MIIIPVAEVTGPLEPMKYELQIDCIAALDVPALVNCRFKVIENIDDGRDDPCKGCFFSTGIAASYCGMMACSERHRSDQTEVIFEEL